MNAYFRPWIAAFSTALLATLLLTAGAHAQDIRTVAETTAQAGSVIVEYGVPGQPLNVAVEAPGRIWVTLPTIDGVGVISRTTPTQAEEISYIVRYWVLPGSRPTDISYHAGNVWFTEQNAGKIGRIGTTDYELQEYVLPTRNSNPFGIDIAANGDVWFTEQASRQLGKLDPTSGVIEEYLFPIAQSELSNVAVATDGSVWFSVPNLNLVGNYDPSRERFYIVPTFPFTRPIGLAIDLAGTPWVAVNGSSAVGRFAPGTVAFWRWTLTPTKNSGPFDLVLDQGANETALMLTEAEARQFARFDIAPDSVVTRSRELGVADQGCQPRGIAVDDSGAAWIACSAANLVIEWHAPFVRDGYLPLVFERAKP